MTRLRVLAAGVVIVVMGLAIAGVGMGGPPAGDPAPTGTALAAAKMRLARADATVREGAHEFKADGCNRCHAVAATGADGRLGPRLDTVTDPVADDEKNITQPRADIAEGYPAKLMPTDYAKRLPKDDIHALAAFIHTVSGGGGAKENDGDDG